jgi:hypothetical protein
MAFENDPSAWTLSQLGNVIDAYVDRTINAPQVVHDASQAYGVDPNGNLYQLGQPNMGGQVGGQVSVGGSPLMLLLIGVVIFMAVK